MPPIPVTLQPSSAHPPGRPVRRLSCPTVTNQLCAAIPPSYQIPFVLPRRTDVRGIARPLLGAIAAAALGRACVSWNWIAWRAPQDRTDPVATPRAPRRVRLTLVPRRRRRRRCERSRYEGAQHRAPLCAVLPPLTQEKELDLDSHRFSYHFFPLRKMHGSSSVESSTCLAAWGDGAAAAASFAARLRCTAPKERSRGAAARGLRWLIMGTVLARTVLGRATLAKKVETGWVVELRIWLV